MAYRCFGILLDFQGDSATNTVVLRTSQYILDDDYDIAIICRFFPEKATTLAVDILNELVEVNFTVVLYFVGQSVYSSQLKTFSMILNCSMI